MHRSIMNRPSTIGLPRRVIFWSLSLLVIGGLSACLVFSDRFFSGKGPPASTDPAFPEIASDEAPPSRQSLRPSLPKRDGPTILPAGIGSGWPNLLGPTHDCRSTEQGLDWKWSESGPVEKWRIPVGAGYSAPVVWGDRLILLHRKEDREIVDCMDAETGRPCWSHCWPARFQCRVSYSNGPYSTPVLEDGRVYALGAAGRLVCLSLNDGRPLWRRDLHEDYGVEIDMWPAAASPLLEQDRLILNLGARKANAGIIAIDKLSGKTLWTATDHGASCSTPRAATIHGARFVFVWTASALVSLAPETGRVHWQIPFFANNREAIHGSSPLVADNLVLVSGYQIGNLCVRVLPDGGYEELWRDKRQSLDSQYNSLLHLDGCVCGFSTTRRDLRCLELATGQLRWKWRSKILNGNLIAVDDRFILLSEKGRLAALRIDVEHGVELLAMTEHRILTPPTFSYPALHKGLLYLRNEEELLCIDLRRADLPKPGLFTTGRVGQTSRLFGGSSVADAGLVPGSGL